MKRYIVVKDRAELGPGHERHTVGVGKHRYDDLNAAKLHAAEQAARLGQPHYVYRLVGVQRPVYDPNVGWMPYLGEDEL